MDQTATMSAQTAAPTRPPVRPYEAKALPVSEDEVALAALNDLCTAVNGFYYPGDRSDAIVQTVAWLRTRPDVCRDLGLGDGAPDRV